MVSGHSFLLSDTDFGVDERAKWKHEQVYVPSQWAEITQRARKSGFEVYEMSTEDFFMYKELGKEIVNRKVNIHGEKV